MIGCELMVSPGFVFEVCYDISKLRKSSRMVTIIARTRCGKTNSGIMDSYSLGVS